LSASEPPTATRRIRRASLEDTEPLESTSHTLRGHELAPTAVRNAISASKAVIAESPFASPQSPLASVVVVAGNVVGGSVVVGARVVVGSVVVVVTTQDTVAAIVAFALALFSGSAGSAQAKSCALS
jgi:hypothetical protein